MKPPANLTVLAHGWYSKIMFINELILKMTVVSKKVVIKYFLHSYFREREG